MLASHGYVVLLPDPRGSDGAGPIHGGQLGGGDFQDVMDDVDALIAKGISDPDHLAIGGWSLGGFMTAWTVTHTNRNENTRLIRTLAFSVGTVHTWRAIRPKRIIDSSRRAKRVKNPLCRAFGQPSVHAGRCISRKRRV